MFRARLTVAGLLALVLVVAGCSAPVAQPGVVPTEQATTTGQTTPDGTDETSITITNGTLGLDPGETFARLQTLRGTDVEPPAELRVFNDPSEFHNQSAGGEAGTEDRFARLAGMSTANTTVPLNVTRQKNGFVTPLGSVVLFDGENATAVDERLLVVHELTHYVQFKTRRQQQLLSAGLDPTTTDGRFVVRALLEGGAIVSTDAYLDRYGTTSDANSEMYITVQEKLPNGHVGKYGNAKYVYGDQYMESRVTDPSELSAVYENPPRTSEQILHGFDPDEEPPVPLAVSLDTGAKWRVSGHDRMGEAFARIALEQWVGPDRAARAAAGWGNDTVQYLRPANGSGETAYVWTLRWDDAANATEFATAYRDSLDARGTHREGLWNLTSESAATLLTPTDRTTVVAFGPESLVGNLTAAGDDGDVTVTVTAASDQGESEPA